MNAEPTGFGYGIDQSIEWMAATEAEIHTTGQPLFRPRTLWQPRPQPRKCRGTKSSGVNHFPSLQGQISGLTHLQNMPLRTGFGKHHRTVQRNLATGVFQITLQRQHQAMTVYDPGLRRPEPGSRPDRGHLARHRGTFI